MLSRYVAPCSYAISSAFLYFLEWGKAPKSQLLHQSHLMTKNLGFGLTKFRCCRSRFDMALHLPSAFELSWSFESVGQGARAFLYLAPQLPLSTMAFPHLKTY